MRLVCVTVVECQTCSPLSNLAFNCHCPKPTLWRHILFRATKTKCYSVDSLCQHPVQRLISQQLHKDLLLRV